MRIIISRQDSREWGKGPGSAVSRTWKCCVRTTSNVVVVQWRVKQIAIIVDYFFMTLTSRVISVINFKHPLIVTLYLLCHVFSAQASNLFLNIYLNLKIKKNWIDDWLWLYDVWFLCYSIILWHVVCLLTISGRTNKYVSLITMVPPLFFSLSNLFWQKKKKFTHEIDCDTTKRKRK